LQVSKVTFTPQLRPPLLGAQFVPFQVQSGDVPHISALMYVPQLGPCGIMQSPSVPPPVLHTRPEAQSLFTSVVHGQPCAFEPLTQLTHVDIPVAPTQASPGVQHGGWLLQSQEVPVWAHDPCIGAHWPIPSYGS
jgi:hypothetical protein